MMLIWRLFISALKTYLRDHKTATRIDGGDHILRRWVLLMSDAGMAQ
jgi:hypothetical protein